MLRTKYNGDVNHSLCQIVELTLYREDVRATVRVQYV